MTVATTLPPGPRGRYLVGNLLDYSRNPLGFLEGCARRYGDVVRLQFPGPPAYLISHPEYIYQVLLAENRNFVKDRETRRSVGFLGNGLLISEGSFWRRQRRLAQPAFHRERITGYGEVMVGYTERMLEGWRSGEARDIHRDMMGLTLEIVTKTLVDADISGEAEKVGEALGAVMAYSSEQGSSVFLRMLPESIPTPAGRRFDRAIQQLDDFIYGIIDERRESGRDTGDLLSMLLHARDEASGEKMDDRQLRDEVMTIVLAGHETTAIALSWTWYLLSQHPEVEGKLHEELDAVLGGRPPETGDLPRLPYTDAVIKESLRLYPPAWAVGREALSDCEVGGYHLPAKSQLFISQWVTHRDPRYFEEPEHFIPERWLGGLEKRLPRYSYFPFGGGPRLCIGNGFAKMEAVLLLSTIARRFRLSPAWKETPVPDPSITLRPKNGIQMSPVSRW